LELLAMILKFDGSYEFLKADLEVLEDYAVRFRYPGDLAEKDQAQAAYASAGIVREFIKQKLGAK
jgi:hypothetical protein